MAEGRSRQKREEKEIKGRRERENDESVYRQKETSKTDREEDREEQKLYSA